jgi:ABC-type antimicrobial peptide transport system permease subunit
MERTLKQVLIEAFVVGLVTIITGNIAVFLIGKSFKPSLPELCDTWNKFYTLEISLFLTGILTHIAFEYSPYGNMNRWYCNTFF